MQHSLNKKWWFITRTFTMLPLITPNMSRIFNRTLCSKDNLSSKIKKERFSEKEVDQGPNGYSASFFHQYMIL